MRMRTIRETAEHFKTMDPNTALTQTALRRLVTTGELPSVRVGNKYLIALETVENYLSGGVQQTQMEPAPARGVIRPVEVSR